MFELPKMAARTQVQTTISQFPGMDLRPRTAAGACVSTQNLRSAYPCLQAQYNINILQSYNNPTDMVALAEKLLVIADGVLHFDGEEIGEVQNCKHQIAIMGNRAVIFPDKLLFDADLMELSQLECTTTQTVEITENTITLEEAVDFVEGDGITLSDTSEEDNAKTAVLMGVDSNILTFSDGCFVPESGVITLSRTLPDLDFICEYNNRIWGVYEDKICCSKLGDPRNWSVFQGLSTDAYEVQVATSGAFTGCAVYGSKVLFLKENCVHKLYGEKPSNFQLSIGRFAGVKSGCERSIVCADDVVYWWSNDGLMYYEGGVSTCLRAALGDENFCCTAAGIYDRTIWLAMEHAVADTDENEQELWIYDMDSGVFLLQNNSKISQFAVADTLHFLSEAEVLVLSNFASDDQAWEMIFAPFERLEEEKIFPQRITLVLDLEENAQFSAFLSRDGAEFVQVCMHIAPSNLQRLRIPMQTGRCNQVQLKLSGTGKFTLRGIMLTAEKGSER